MHLCSVYAVGLLLLMCMFNKLVGAVNTPWCHNSYMAVTTYCVVAGGVCTVSLTTVELQTLRLSYRDFRRSKQHMHGPVCVFELWMGCGGFWFRVASASSFFC